MHPGRRFDAPLTGAAPGQDRSNDGREGEGAPGGEVAEVAELERLRALRSFGVLDTDPEEAFDDLTALAAHVCGTPMALVSLVDSDRQWFKSRLGLAVCQTPREVSFCAHALSGDRALVVSDATLDPRFADNPLVTGEPGLRFYAGAPLVTGTGYVLGTLCVLDVVPRALSGLQVEHLTALARQVVSQLELRRQAEALATEVGARAAAQATLRESQRLLQGVLDHTDVVVYAKDLDGRYLLANQAHARLLDREDGGVLGCSDYDLFPALAADEFRRHDLQVAASGRREVFAEQVTHLDGTVHGYLSTKFPLRDDTGRVYAVAGVSTDVTELTREREAHAEAEQRWKALVELSPVAVAVLGADERFAYANPAAAELYGASPAGPLVGRRASDLVPADDDGQVATQFGALLAGGPALLAHRWTLRRLDGAHTTVEVNAAAMTYRGERAVQVELRYVTAQVAAQAALSASEQRFRALFACLPVGAAESLPDGTLLTVNARLCAMLGYTAEELIGQPLNFLLADPADPAEQRSELDALSQTSGYVAERTYRRKDGTGLQVLVGVGVVRDDTGQVHRVLGSIVDVSDRVEAEQALQQAHRDLAARQAFTDAVLDSVDVGIVACDATGRLTVFNDATRRWHGVDLMGDNDAAVDPDHFARAFDLHDGDGQILTTDQIPLLRALNEGAVHDVEMVISPRDRHATRVLCTGRAMSGPDSQPLGAVVAMSDITAARAQTRALQASEQRFRTTFTNDPTGLALLDRHGQAVQVNPALCLLLGRTEGELRRLAHVGELAALDDQTAVYDLLTQALAGDGTSATVEKRLQHSDGTVLWALLTATWLPDSEPGSSLLLQVQDVSERKATVESLTRQAFYDDLTGLPNRTMLLDRTSRSLARLARRPDGGLVAMLFLDLNGFKAVNDAYGHSAGDAVLTETARRFDQAMRPTDTVARLGGDEFVVLCENLPDHDEAPRIARRLEQAITVPVPWGTHRLGVTASVGIAYGASGTSGPDLLRQADTAMYQAKRLGKNR